MASSSASVICPIPPLPNKRGQGAIGADLIITYHSDLAQCEILPAGSRYTNAGNFKAGTFLPFIQPAFILDLYPRLLNGWETEETQSVQVALALPRDGGLTPIVPRLLGDSDEGAPWPSSPAHVSLAGPVDLDTFHIKEDVWPEPLSKTSVFIKLGSYLMPESDRPPHKGVHVCHVLLLFPVERQPWSSLLGWMRQAANPFPKGSWIVCSGRILGVLNRELIQGPQLIDSTVRILVILPDDWEFVRQSALSTHNTSMPTSSNPVNEPPTPPRPAGPGGVTSRNPFSSPIRGQKQSPQRKAASLPSKQSDREATKPPACPGEKHTPLNPTTADVDPVLPIPSSDSDRTDDGSDTEQLLDDQLAPTTPTPIRKRKKQSTPELIRSKRTRPGKRRA
ncbi:hypothetical protein BGZ61DRAFT_370535 [Ilyonectria robusta]|uniref:uncharacterized protein n=1 Tax=Ilyonectria robusta TaxID=1079257 RepID=UPI001E8CFF83|nr:uncharacterized protein BGZ61DRAFT_370535 [Ilyonectria robusta]KAH8659483.1 hypothetical protein BGZ61DRAFT_370535 [Ilyonectria robusta]